MPCNRRKVCPRNPNCPNNIEVQDEAQMNRLRSILHGIDDALPDPHLLRMSPKLTHYQALLTASQNEAEPTPQATREQSRVEPIAAINPPKATSYGERAEDYLDADLQSKLRD